MKKGCRLLICVALLMITVGMTACFGDKDEYSGPKRGVEDIVFRYFWWEDDNSYYISGTNVEEQTPDDHWEMIDVVIPTEYNGHPVTVIGWDSFRQCQILRSVIIPEGIKGIHGGVFFDCDSLESVHLPKSMKDFHGTSFRGCNSLKEVTVDPDNPWFCSVDGVVYTKDQKELVFYPPGKENVEFSIPEGCSVIARYAFADCENLKRILIPSTVTDISYESIVFCKGMEGVIVDKANENFASIGGNLYSKDGKTFLRLCVSTEIVSLTLPEGVEVIGTGAAFYCPELTAVTLPTSLISIGRLSFSNCKNLTSVNIPENVTFIGHSAFVNCNKLDAFFAQKTGWSAVPDGGKFTSTAKLGDYMLESPFLAGTFLADTYAYREWYREN